MSDDDDDDRPYDEPEDEYLLNGYDETENRPSLVNNNFSARRILEQLREKKELERMIRDNFDD